MSYKKSKNTGNIFRKPSSYLIEVDERELAKRSAEGDKKAFELIVERYEKFIFRYILWRVGEVEHAKDITADVFLKAFCGIKNFKGESLKFWLMRIAENGVKDFYRKEKRKKEVSIEEAGFDGVEKYGINSGLENSVEQEETRKLIQSGIKKLSSKYADVIILRYFMEMNIYEISSYLKISTNRVRSRIFRAIRKLRKIKELQDFLGD